MRWGRSRIAGWRVGLSVALLAAQLLVPPPPLVARGATCFGELPTITDNGPGDLDPRPHVILGTPGRDVIVGTDAADAIDGNGENDAICGGGADDVVTVPPMAGAERPWFPLSIDGGLGSDTITVPGYRVGSITRVEIIGGEGDDTLAVDTSAASNADCRVEGGPGNDVIRARCNQLALLRGGPGDDAIEGFAPRGSGIYGDEGDDILTATGHNCGVDGGPGNDVVEVGCSASGVSGGDGHDEIRVSYRGGDSGAQVSGGPGDDRIVIELSGGVLVDGGPGDDAIDASAVDTASQVILRGGEGNDRIEGGSALTRPQQLEGGPGDDRLVGGPRVDVLDGGDGRDTCIGDPGQDTFVGCEVRPTGDTTPPVITPVVRGTAGEGGWYTSDVTVSWTVADPESPIQATSGCEAGAVAADTGGVTFTCTATSGGGTASRSVTVKRDATPPTVGCTVSPATLWPPNGKLVPVTASVEVADALSGRAGFVLTSATSSGGGGAEDIRGFTPGMADTTGELRAKGPGVSAGHLEVGAPSVYTLTYTAKDLAGNTKSCAVAVTVPHVRRV